MTILIIIATGLMIATAVIILNTVQIRNLRLKGLYPAQGHATMKDVEKLINSGNKALAMRAYREIHGVSLKQAKEAVEKISNAA